METRKTIDVGNERRERESYRFKRGRERERERVRWGRCNLQEKEEKRGRK